MRAECGGKAAKGVAAAGCAGLAFEPGHRGDAYPGQVGELFLGQSVLAAPLPQLPAVDDNGRGRQLAPAGVEEDAGR
jgi:hypothetical protein